MYKILTNSPLPDSEDGFLDDTRAYYPNLYDLKFMKEEFDDLKGGLSRLGEMLDVDRFGQQHQAGSDSWLTGLSFYKLKEMYLHGKNLDIEYNNVLFGLGKRSKNDEAYLDQYTSRTEQYEREDREYQPTDEQYNNGIHGNQYGQYPTYYSVSPSPMDYTNENMIHSYGYGHQMMHPSQQMHNMHHGYSISPNHINNGMNEYSVNMSYPMQFSQMAGSRQDHSNMNEYQNDNYYN